MWPSICSVLKSKSFFGKITFKNTVDRGETLKCNEIFEAAFLLFSVKECDWWQGCQTLIWSLGDTVQNLESPGLSGRVDSPVVGMFLSLTY